MTTIVELMAPKFSFSREKSTAQRQIYLPIYSELPQFLAAEFPATVGGYPVSDDVFPIPGFQWLYVKTINVQQISDKLDSAVPPNPSAGWLLDVDYESQPYNNQNGGNNKSNDLPGSGTPNSGGPGGAGGAGTDVMLSYEVDIGGNFITYPSTALQWVSDSMRPHIDVQPGVIEVTVEHSITWHHVALPPWAALRRCAGRVNQRPFLGAPMGCLLFGGANCSREFDMTGNRTWTMKMKFSEKMLPAVINPALKALDPTGTIYGAGGWNFFLRPNLPTGVAYDVLKLGKSTNPVQAIYPFADFTNLFVPGGK